MYGGVRRHRFPVKQQRDGGLTNGGVMEELRKKQGGGLSPHTFGYGNRPVMQPGMTNGLTNGLTNGMGSMPPDFYSRPQSLHDRYRRKRSIQSLIVCILVIVIFMFPIVALLAQTEVTTPRVCIVQHSISTNKITHQGWTQIATMYVNITGTPSATIQTMSFKGMGTIRESGVQYRIDDGSTQWAVFSLTNGLATANINRQVTQNTSITISFSTQANTPRQNSVMLELTDATATVTPLVEHATRRYSYWGALDTAIRIDGFMGDWEPYLAYSDAAGDVANANVDLLQAKFVETYGYVKVAGTILNGNAQRICTPPVQHFQEEPAPPSGEPVGGDQSGVEVISPMYTDVLLVYIDSDNDNSTGCANYGAEHMVYIAGRANNIEKAKEYAYNITTLDWDEIGDVLAVNDKDQIEYQTSIVQYNRRKHIFATGWNATEDSMYVPAPSGTRGGIGYGLYGGETTMYAVIGSQPTIDGVLSEDEWGDADNYTVSTTIDADMKLYTKRDASYVYVAVETLNDTTASGDDECRIAFDTGHNATADPDTNDLMLVMNGALTYYVGDGTAWVQQDLPPGWSAARGTTDTHRSYEFRIPISDLNMTGDFWQPGDIVGFSVYTYQNTSNGDRYVWYPDNESETLDTQHINHPNTYSDLQILAIPEMRNVVIAVGFVMIVCVVSFKRRQR